MPKRLFAAALTLILFTPAVLAVPEDSAAVDLSCKSAILMEKETGTVLYDRDSHKKLAPASVTKIMTMLLVMEALDSGAISSDDTVTVSANAAGMGGSQVYLKQGEQMSVRELLKCVAVVSGNDCAVALAEYLAGSESAFVARMNERAAQLNMTDTTFLNCTGLPAPGHETSAHDIALMSRELILNHPDIRQYTTVWMDSIRDGTFGLTNTNRLIRFYEGATGLKTGSTDAALYCMSATAQREGMELIAVVMAAPTTVQRFSDAQSLLDYGFSQYALMDVHPDVPLPTVEVLLGKTPQVQAVLSRPCRLLVEKQARGEVSTQLDLCENVQAPVESGQTLGKMLVFVGDELRDSIPITAATGVSRLRAPEIFEKLLQQILMSR
jgi:D-alanyl-D-alanine carboxypeptidase (penicillin-binding protein 5/6)